MVDATVDEAVALMHRLSLALPRANVDAATDAWLVLHGALVRARAQLAAPVDE